MPAPGALSPWSRPLAALVAIGLAVAPSRSALADEPAQPAKDAKDAKDQADEMPARIPLPPEPKHVPVPWERHLDLAAGFVVVEKLLAKEARGTGGRTGVLLNPGPGYSVQLGWEVLKYLRFSAYAVGSYHSATLPVGALGLDGVSLESGLVRSYSFGARIHPMLPLGERVRLWLTVGVGFGRIEYEKMTAKEPNKPSFTLPARASSLVEVPVGIGASFEIIKRWLAIQIEVTASATPSQFGDAVEPSQTVDGAGKKRTVGSLPNVSASFSQTLSLALLL